MNRIKEERKSLVIAVVIIAVIGFALNYSRVSAEYYSNMVDAYNTMLNEFVEGEEAAELIHDVWYNAIWDWSNKDTYKYVKGTDDFNEALENLFADKNFVKRMESIGNNMSGTLSLMKTLNHPPEQYEEAYQDLKALYDFYFDYRLLATNPKGRTIMEFTEEYNDLEQKILKKMADV
ncbi:hypothetical protein [Senimuribacter intestinalis]|uniref:hypothetical protein n=1 Tax=Senimuribacter intestinalis TaxID=2941507 RepID=UPI00203E51E1|nr:hypothetical protein [Senimuribacter intestinalis]